MNLPIYLDNHATTPVDPRVLEAMTPFFTHTFGNPASRQHQFGWAAQAAVEEARESIAHAVGAEPKEIIFTSGATESINLALKGAAEARQDRGRHLITTAVEHPAVLDTMKRLAGHGFETTVLPVDEYGRVPLDSLRSTIRPDTILVSVILANNEIGTINPLEEIGRICRERGVLLHSDATQAVGKIPVSAREMKIDLMACSAHKFYGPKGVGVCVVRRGEASSGKRLRLPPLHDGGGHERGMRSGTLNVPGIVGMAAALRIALDEMSAEAPRQTALRERLRAGLEARISPNRRNGHPTERLPGNLNISFPFAEGEALMMSLREIALSSGSACTSAKIEPSHVLKALGLDDETVHSSLRFGIGRWTTEEEIDYTISRVTEEVERLRALSPKYETYRRGRKEQ